MAVGGRRWPSMPANPSQWQPTRQKLIIMLTRPLLCSRRRRRPRGSLVWIIYVAVGGQATAPNAAIIVFRCRQGGGPNSLARFVCFDLISTPGHVFFSTSAGWTAWAAWAAHSDSSTSGATWPLRAHQPKTKPGECISLTKLLSSAGRKFQFGQANAKVYRNFRLI